MLRVVIIGAGKIAGSHLKAIEQMNRLRAIAIADVQEARALETASRYGLVAYTDYRKMLEQERADIAIVALPHFLHKQAAFDCADVGCHILMEKPMALNVAECDEMIAAAERNCVQLMVGLTQHYFRENKMAKQIIERGDLGKLIMINDTRHQHYFMDTRPDWFLSKEKAGGGIITNLGAHSVDKIQWLLDSRIHTVRAKLTHYADHGDVEGSGCIYAMTDAGIPATIVQSGYKGVPINDTHLIFTEGMLKLVTGRGIWISDNGSYREVPLPESANPYILQLQEFIDAIDGARPLECSGEYARTVNEVLEGIYRSHTTGKEEVV
ncbi:Gfo/Idh/MocA family protein [Paenibacillus alginolyticus]|uniref:Gfo/Idh/MocA family oxidoreductase n=1 Tax=Paenibacillus alginolyticus TaxID=59839 RepID=A0ABT4GM32_9BACL|nr:Gfo/Idh/MocA family oxidoreductase [Paenibacillus alginolyticus]MCY9697089.1 Gfo/Idh/MocA family oxidoreductase [Paenibacillus alginolyticus]MEC0146281.1 Gfo/Idh/MocA family oxidoreductase [Paenibacillus alginolyticus]